MLCCGRWRSGWTWKRLEDVFALGVPLGLLAILLYLPFYVGFSSQAGGILPNLENPTRGAQLWIMFGPLFLAIFAFLIYLWRTEKHPANWKARHWLGFRPGFAVVDRFLAAGTGSEIYQARFGGKLPGQATAWRTSHFSFPPRFSVGFHILAACLP